jgi:hypothetical protein
VELGSLAVCMGSVAAWDPVVPGSLCVAAVVGSVVACAGDAAAIGFGALEEALGVACVVGDVLDPVVPLAACVAVCVVVAGVLAGAGPLSATVPSPFIVMVALPAGRVTV